jgi:ribA/ribD-fused uncharacterized protein
MGGAPVINRKNYPQFDNFYENMRIQYNGMIWKSSEQLYQALKFKDLEYRKKINGAFSTNVAYELGQSRNHELVDNFESIKKSLMYEANLAKFSQNPELAELLTSTYPYPIFCFKSSAFWNKANQEILTEIREALLTQPSK